MARLVGGVNFHHPTRRERENGAVSRAYLAVDRGLKSGKLDEVELTEDDLLDLIAEGAKALRALRKARR